MFLIRQVEVDRQGVVYNRLIDSGRQVKASRAVFSCRGLKRKKKQFPVGGEQHH